MTDNKTSDDKIFEQLDQEKLKQEIKAEAVEEAKKALIENIQGKKPKYSWEEEGKTKPDSYDELFEEVDKRTVKPDDIAEVVDKKLKEKEEQETKRAEEERKRKESEIKKNREDFDKEWYSLIHEGKMPAPAKELQEKINKGEQLTRDEIMGDEGLKARLELAQIAQSKNKSAKLAYYEDLNQQPAGTKAPVLGTRPSTSQTESKELEYADVAKNRKRLFGF